VADFDAAVASLHEALELDPSGMSALVAVIHASLAGISAYNNATLEDLGVSPTSRHCSRLPTEIAGLLAAECRCCGSRGPAGAEFVAAR
jgi:hypothetical protein